MDQHYTGKFHNAMLTQIYPDKIADHFSVQSYLSSVGQNFKANFLVQCWLKQIKATLYSLFSCKNMSVRPWPTLLK